jgi:N-acyl-D-amino-acid deacylase
MNFVQSSWPQKGTKIFRVDPDLRAPIGAGETSSLPLIFCASLWPKTLLRMNTARLQFLRLRRRPFLATVLGALLAAVALQAQIGSYDILITNARIVDGTGNPWFRGQIGIRGDTIAAIALNLNAPAARTIDAGGLVVAPGFIDLHVHAFQGATPQPPEPLPILELPTADNYIRQGVTTLLGGPDGFSPIPLRPILRRVQEAGTTPNIGSFIGHGSIRAEVVGLANRPPTPAELDRMRTIVREAMRDGAFGLSTGLFYLPSTFAKTEEVIALAQVAGAMGGIHISHIREEAALLTASVAETIRIGEEGGLPTQVTHHKTMGKLAWGKTVETLKLVDEARSRGVDVTIDLYPYTASSTLIEAALLPAWAQEGGKPAILQRLREPETRQRILRETIRFIVEERGGGDPHNVQIARCDWRPELAGKRLDEIPAMRGLVPSLENAADSALWIVENGGAQGIFHAIDEGDLRRVLAHPASMIASDGGPVVFGRAVPHPRSYGTFARVLGHYVREERVISLEAAVRKMTSLPAQRIGLSDRGVLRPGMKADVVIFDPATVRDKATFEQPHQYAEGFKTVLVNGKVVFHDGKMTGEKPGRVLYGPARVE